MTDRNPELFEHISPADGENSHNSRSSLRKRRKPARRLEKKRRKKQGSPLVTISIFLFVLAGLYLFAGFYLLPHYLQKKLPEVLQEKCGLQAQIGRVVFNPFNFKVLLSNFSIFEPLNSGKKLVYIPKAEAGIAPVELMRNNYVLKFLTIREPEINLIRYEGTSYNFSRNNSRKNLAKPEDFFDFEDLPFFYSINNISIENGRLSFNDRPSGQRHFVRDISIGIPVIANFAYQTRPLVDSHFSAVVNGSPLEIIARKNDHGQATGAIAIKDADLSAYAKYLPLRLPAELTGGRANGSLVISLDRSDDQKRSFLVDFKLKVKEITAANKNLALSIPAGQIDGSFYPFSEELHFSNIYLQKPVVTISDTFSVPSLDALLPYGRSTFSGRSLSIERFAVEDGLLAARGGNKAANWSEIQFNLDDFHSGSRQPAPFKLTAVQKNNGKNHTILNWQGSMQDGAGFTGELSVQNLDPNLCAAAVFPQGTKFTGKKSLLQGSFTVSLKSDGTSQNRIFYALNGGTIEINDPSFTYKKSPVKAGRLKFTGLEYGRELPPSGNLALTGLSLDLATDSLAGLFTPLLGQDNRLLKSFKADGKLRLTNPKTKADYIFNKFSLTTTAAGKDQEKQKIKFSGQTSGGGEITASGTGKFVPLSMNLSVNFKNLKSQNLLPLFTGNQTAADSKSTISGQGKYSFPQSGYYGSVNLSDTAVVINGQRKMTVKRAKIPALNFKIAPFSLRMGSLDLQQPVFYWDKRVGKTPPGSFSAFLTSIFPTQNMPKELQKYKYPFYQLGQVKISNGTIVVSEKGTNTSYKSLGGEVNHLQFPAKGSKTSFNLRALQNGADFQVKGTGNFFSRPTRGVLEFSFKDIIRNDLVKQAGKLGLAADQSRISGTLLANWHNGKFQNHTSLQITGLLPLKNNSPGAVALAMLYKNSPELKIGFDHPGGFSGLSMAEGAANYFKKAVVKAGVSPFLLADGFTELAEVNLSGFHPGSTELTAEGRQTLLGIGEVLKRHPALVIILAGRVGSEDLAKMQEELDYLENERVEKENQRLKREWQARKERLERQRAAAKTEVSADEIVEQDLLPAEIGEFTPILPDLVAVTDDMERSLAADRARAAASFLTDELGVNVQQVQSDGKFSKQKGRFGGAVFTFSTRFKAAD